MGYANGPGFNIEAKDAGEGNITCVRPLPSQSEDKWSKPEQNSDLLWPTGALRDSETHGGDDVAVMAQGPWVSI